VTEPATVFPWVELAGSGGVAAALSMCWMFLKHLKDQKLAENEALKEITSQFAQTIRIASTDVKEGMAVFQAHTAVLLADGRDRETRMHELLRETRAALTAAPLTQ
jgi:hypothetical protein